MITTIPLKLLSIDNDGYHLLASLKINNKKALVIIDTGASRSVFDKERIKRFVQKRSKKIKDKLSTGLGTNTMQSHQITFRSISIGKLKLKDYVTVLLDLSHVNNSYRQLGMNEIDGVIGSDILQKHHAVIDYKKAILKLSY